LLGKELLKRKQTRKEGRMNEWGKTEGPKERKLKNVSHKWFLIY
jgi:hypothetical protein